MAEFGGGFSPPVRRQGMSERSPLLPRAHSPGGDESEALAWDDDLLPEAELKEDVPSSLLEHGRSITVGHRAFAAATHASAARVFASREVSLRPFNLPGVTCVAHPAWLPVRAWTAYMLVITATYVAFLVPIFFAFDCNLSTPAVAAIDMLAGAAFALDLLVNFRTGLYFLCAGHFKLVLDAPVIAREYIHRNFAIDFLSAVPFFVQVGFYALSAIIGERVPLTNGAAVWLIRGMRLLRGVRLWKLFSDRRALLGGEIFLSVQSGTPLLVFAATVVYWFAFLASLFASVYVGVASVEGICDSWVARLGTAVTPGASLSDLIPTRCPGVIMPSPATTYVASLYFATTVLTTNGFGDIVAQSLGERIVVILFMLAGCFFVAAITGRMVSVLAEHFAGREQEQRFRDTVVRASAFVRQHGLPPASAAAVQRYVQQAYQPREDRATVDDASLLAELPVRVRAAAIANMAGEAALRAAFKGASAASFEWLAGRMAPRTVAPSHYLCLEGSPCSQLLVTACGSLRVATPGLGHRPGDTGRGAGWAGSAGVLAGRGHALGAAALADAIEVGSRSTPAADDGDASAADDADASAAAETSPPARRAVWRASVFVSTECSAFILSFEQALDALRLADASASERQLIAASLRAADAVDKLLDGRGGRAPLERAAVT